MSNTKYKLYQSQVYELAKTLVIKFHAAGEAINTGLLLNHSIVASTTNFTSWKYYKNLAGQKHETDPTIMIRAIEGGVITDIEFSRENLKHRQTTRREYYYGSRFYNDLIRRFPDQETRILGVLYPIIDNDDVDLAISLSMQKAIDAEDGDIINYRSDLVEPQETNLIPELQKWIKNFLKRWYIPEYGITDDYYFATLLGTMYVNLPSVIMNIRLANCKTNMAHSFHIREYLESNGRLGQYFDMLTTEQALYLYRNIRYIQRNAGKQTTFGNLVDNILSKRNIPVANHLLRHNLNNQPIELKPEVELYRTAINFRQVGVGSDTIPPLEILDKEVDLSRNFEMVPEDELVTTNYKMKNSLSNQVSTKVLDSQMIDSSDSVTYPLTDVLFNNWVYRASINKYSAPIYITNPSSGDRLLLNTKDAFILYIYLYSYANHLDGNQNHVSITEIPKFFVTNIIREVPPSLAQLQSVVNHEYITPDKLQKILNDPLELTVDYLSAEEFYDAMVDVQKRLMDWRNLYVIEEGYRERGYMEFAVSLMRKDIDCELAPAGTLYADWLIDKGIDLSGMSIEDYRLLSVEIFRTATGISSNSKISLQDIQKAMISIMKQLSSYSIQYLYQMNAGNDIVEDAATIRTGDFELSIADESNAIIPTAWVEEQETKFKHLVTMDIFGEKTKQTLDYSLRHEVKLDNSLRVSFDQAYTDSIRILIPTAQTYWDDTETQDLGTIITVTDIPEYINPL